MNKNDNVYYLDDYRLDPTKYKPGSTIFPRGGENSVWDGKMLKPLSPTGFPERVAEDLAVRLFSEGSSILGGDLLTMSGIGIAHINVLTESKQDSIMMLRGLIEELEEDE